MKLLAAILLLGCDQVTESVAPGVDYVTARGAGAGAVALCPETHWPMSGGCACSGGAASVRLSSPVDVNGWGCACQNNTDGEAVATVVCVENGD